MDIVHAALENTNSRMNMPANYTKVVAPTDYMVRSLDRVLSPQEVMREELAFARQVALSLGVPSAMLLQCATAMGGGVAGSNLGMSWADGFEGSNRCMIDTCRTINGHLEAILYDAYRKVYSISSAHAPIFKLPLVPTVPFEQLMSAYQAQLIDDQHVSRILEATWGVGLGKEARACREQQQKADYVLPFRDKKPTP
jgi:hypothetical protein